MKKDKLEMENELRPTEKIAALMTEGYRKEWSKTVIREKYEAIG